MKEHVNPLSLGQSQSRKYSFYVKMGKCEFAQQEIKFVGHLVSINQIQMDPKKVQVIVDWQEPRSVKDLRSFLGLANYYRKFITGYSKRGSDFDKFVEERYEWVWSNRCEEAF